MKIGDIDPEEIASTWEATSVEDEAMTETITVAASTRKVDDDAGSTEGLPVIATDAGGASTPEVKFGDTIGEGGSGVVVAARQVPLDRDIAAKLVREGRGESGGWVSMLQEALVTGKLEHPNIVPVYRLGRDEAGNPVLLMKQIEGTSWAELLDAGSDVPREVEAHDVLDWHLDILIDVCHGVEYAHEQGVLHRDLKPENVMIGEFGEVYLVDWGLAVTMDENPDSLVPRAADIAAPAGTPAYIAPEMVVGLGGMLSERTDVYLLGATLYRLVNGEPPHQGDELFDVLRDASRDKELEFADDVPDRLEMIVRRAMARDPEERYPSVTAFRHDLAEFQRQRESLRLSREAAERIEALEAAISEEDGPPGDENSPYEIFGECRFGFEQALEVSEHNEQAREGLQRSLELMIEYELEREGHEAAAMLLAELPEERPELADRVERLGEKLDSRERELEELKELQREADVDRGRRARSKFVVVMALLFAALGLAPRFLGEWVETSAGFMGYLGQGLLVATFLAVGFWLGRGALFQNRANRRMILCLVAVFAVEWLVRFACGRFGVGVGETMVLEMLMTGMGATLMAATLDRRIAWAAGPYLVGGVASTYLVESVHEINAVTNLLALGLLGWAWWPGSDTADASDGP